MTSGSLAGRYFKPYTCAAALKNSVERKVSSRPACGAMDLTNFSVRSLILYSYCSFNPYRLADVFSRMPMSTMFSSLGETLCMPVMARVPLRLLRVLSVSIVSVRFFNSRIRCKYLREPARRSNSRISPSVSRNGATASIRLNFLISSSRGYRRQRISPSVRSRR